MKKRYLSLVLALAMVFTLIPASIFADGEEEIVEQPAAVEPVVEMPAPVVETTEPAEAPAAAEPEAAPAANAEPEAAEQPQEPAEQPEAPVEQPEAPAEQPEAPAEQPEVPAEQPEEPAEEPATEAGAEEPEPAEEPVVDAFVAGLAKLTAGAVYSDKWQKEEAGTVTADAIVYAIERVTGEGELAGNHIIRIAANVNGQAKVFFVKNNRLSYLNADQTAVYQNAKHDNGIDYMTVKLDPIAFETAVAEVAAEEIAEEPAEASIRPLGD